MKTSFSLHSAQPKERSSGFVPLGMGDDMMLLLHAFTSFLCANFGLQVAASHAATPRIALPARTKVSVECMAAEQERRSCFGRQCLGVLGGRNVLLKCS